MRILLTGSSGWLGRFLASMLREAGHEVVGLDIAPGKDTQVVGSIADKALIDRTVADHDFEAVIHGGALHQPDLIRYLRRAFVDVNVTGTLNLLEAAVAAGHDRFIFTSTTSLMISQAIRDESAEHAVWIDEELSPLEPRNIYGVTKLAAERLCGLFHADHGLAVTILRTSRFFPEDDDLPEEPAGENLKANEFLNRRLTVEDAARSHLVALDRAREIGFGTFIVSAPTPFARDEAEELKRDAASVVLRHFPEAAEQFAKRGWVLPRSISRVYDSSLAEKQLGFRCETNFAAVLQAMETGAPLPFVQDAAYVSPGAGMLEV